MRAILSFAAALSVFCSSGQTGVPDDRMASAGRPDTARPEVRRWGGAGGSFATDPTVRAADGASTGERVDTVRVDPRRWNRLEGDLRPGQPIAPLPMRAITWEFGDGSLSNVLPPRPWRSSEAVKARNADMSPFREQAGGSPCVLSCATPRADGPDDPQAYVVSGSGGLTLVTTGLEACALRVRIADGITPRSVLLEKCFTSGRWSLPARDERPGPRFITVQDLSTGAQWCAGVEL